MDLRCRGYIVCVVDTPDKEYEAYLYKCKRSCDLLYVGFDNNDNQLYNDFIRHLGMVPIRKDERTNYHIDRVFHPLPQALR